MKTPYETSVYVFINFLLAYKTFLKTRSEIIYKTLCFIENIA